MITIKTFVFNSFQENTYLLFDETKECIIVDAGCYTQNEYNELSSFIEKNNLTPVKLINTHGHIDHILGIEYFAKKYNLKAEAHVNDIPIIEQASFYGKVFGLDLENHPKIDVYLKEGDVVSFGNSSIQVFHVPGHSPGSVAFYSAPDNFVITGDVLFKGSIGRTDLTGGSLDQLMDSINSKLLTLPDDTLVFPGHGSTTTIGEERNTNPFLV
jgi:hydroxyacylglutathione hydrolase